RTQERTQVIQLFFKPDDWVRHVHSDSTLTSHERDDLLEWAGQLWSNPWQWAADYQPDSASQTTAADAQSQFRHRLVEWALDVQFFVFGFLVGKITEEL